MKGLRGDIVDAFGKPGLILVPLFVFFVGMAIVGLIGQLVQAILRGQW